jgi:hypothetical protein
MSIGSNGVDQVRSLRQISRNFVQQTCALMVITFGYNGVDRVRSLREILTRLCLANLCVSGTSSTSFASTFVQ